ncbi:hypothetical protein AVEN_202556-1 [Araneus ventricosus]|uniref:Uncharacterized protein n=1 Tax=Araneus ventricosus TaxID=182803 RepID=A0A4Y2W0Q6_ARAVE|nr:hypothetical protein AVEN_202556-1 [Araneus ventricosus]
MSTKKKRIENLLTGVFASHLSGCIDRVLSLAVPITILRINGNLKQRRSPERNVLLSFSNVTGAPKERLLNIRYEYFGRTQTVTE